MGQNVIPIGFPNATAPVAPHPAGPPEPARASAMEVQDGKATGPEQDPQRLMNVQPADSGITPMVGLLIERDEASGGYVYKTIDRATGEVLRQLPREEVLKLRRAEHYSPGNVIDTEV